MKGTAAPEAHVKVRDYLQSHAVWSLTAHGNLRLRVHGSGGASTGWRKRGVEWTARAFQIGGGRRHEVPTQRTSQRYCDITAQCSNEAKKRSASGQAMSCRGAAGGGGRPRMGTASQGARSETTARTRMKAQPGERRRQRVRTRSSNSVSKTCRLTCDLVNRLYHLLPHNSTIISAFIAVSARPLAGAEQLFASIHPC